MQHAEPNFNTTPQGDTITQLDALTAPLPRPRFGNLPLSHADTIRLLFYAETLAKLWWDSLRAEAGDMPVTSALCTEVRAIVARAEGKIPAIAEEEAA